MPTQDQILAELQRLNVYKPPPPYPGTNANGQHQHLTGGETRMISSTSTPDLATSNVVATFNATHTGGALLGGSSPDLVSRKNLGKVRDNSTTTLHKTMDNLHNFIEQQMQYEEEANKKPTAEQTGGFSQQVSQS